MRIGPLLLLAARRLRQRPVRSFLLLQGTVWGVAVAIFPSAVLQGTRQAAEQRSAEIGADRVSVASDPTSAVATQLERDDVEAARAAVEAAGVKGALAAGVRVAREWPGPGGGSGVAAPVAALLAASPQAPALRGHRLAQGRWLADDDPPEACVVEAGVAGWLGRASLAPGERLRLPGQAEELRVVGVLAARSALALRTDDLGFDLEHPMYARLARGFLLAMGLPVVRDGWKRSDRCVWVGLGSVPTLDWILLRTDPGDVSRAATAAREALAGRRRAVLTLYPLVLPMLLSGQVERFSAVNVAMFLACLAMGAVVMANLGLLNVLTRGREIAVRRVEGATRRDVALQLVLEGLLLTAAGCGLGLGLGMGLASLRARLEPTAGFTWVFPWTEAAVAVLVALLVGLAAALLPALKAAAQDPVDGLVDD